jgi:hypothetical protein
MRGYLYPTINTDELNLSTIPDGGVLIAFNQNGELIKATKDGIEVIQGIPGPPGQDGTNGINGTDGIDGIDGTNGTNGQHGHTPRGISKSRYDEVSKTLVIEYTDGTVDNVGNITNDDRFNSKFYYGSEMPENTGTSAIILGSVWYNTDTYKTYVYIFDGISYYWVIMAIPANTYEGLTDSSIQHITDEQMKSKDNSKIGLMIYNTTFQKIFQWNGREWIKIE